MAVEAGRRRVLVEERHTGVAVDVVEEDTGPGVVHHKFAVAAADAAVDKDCAEVEHRKAVVAEGMGYVEERHREAAAEDSLAAGYTGPVGDSHAVEMDLVGGSPVVAVRSPEAAPEADRSLAAGEEGIGLVAAVDMQAEATAHHRADNHLEVVDKTLFFFSNWSI